MMVIKKIVNQSMVCLFAIVFLVNCGSDDEVNALDALVGTWRSTSIASSGCTDTSQNGTIECTPYCIEIIINSNGTYSITNNLDDPTSKESGSASATATAIKLCETGDNNCVDDNPYTLSGSTLVVSFTDEESPGCTFSATFNKQ